MQTPPSDHNTSRRTAEAVPVVIDIACPRCEYNLRGLVGPVVVCPECGLESDVPELAARRWDKPWYKAPGFNTLIWPAFCGWLWVFFVLPVTAVTIGDQTATVTIGLLGLAVWAGLMYRAYRVFDEALAVGLALAGHLLVAGFVAGVFGLIWSVIAAVVYVLNPPARVELSDMGVWVVLTGVWGALLWVCRRVERRIAGACIRRYLRRRPKP